MANLTDADKVIRNDVGKSIVSKLDDIADAIVQHGGGAEQAIRDMIYPVGSIYMSVTDNTVAKVEARFGGTWVAFGAGRTLVGVNANETEFNSVEKTGGEKKHTLNRSEIPSHNHGIGLNQTGSVHFTGFWHLKLTTGTNIKNTNADETIGDTATNLDGGGQAHNNLQPYVTVYMYKRTA